MQWCYRQQAIPQKVTGGKEKIQHPHKHRDVSAALYPSGLRSWCDKSSTRTLDLCLKQSEH